jgi:predicted nucleotidyltransferase
MLIDEKIIDVFISKQVKLAYIFGSSVSNNSENSQDVDIAIYLNESKKYK